MKTKCLLCGETEWQIFLSGNGWKYYKCDECGLIQNPDVKVTIDEYHRDEDYKKYTNLFSNIFETRMEFLAPRLGTNGRVLEIGCSSGTFLKLFANIGWETWGVEPSGSFIEAERLGFKVLHSDFESAELPINYFDLVVLNHTLEHVENPVEILAKVNKILVKGGYVFIDVPNFGSLSARVLGKHWPLLLPHEHRFQFTNTILKNILQRTGFDFVDQASRSGIFEYKRPLDVGKRLIKMLPYIPLDILETYLNMGQSVSILGKKT